MRYVNQYRESIFLESFLFHGTPASILALYRNIIYEMPHRALKIFRKLNIVCCKVFQIFVITNTDKNGFF